MAQSLRLPALFSHGCVFQRGGTVPVWGWAAAGVEVRVSCAEVMATTTTGADGRWRLDLAELPVGGPWTLAVTTAYEALRVADVLVGEVWLASGQSNMDMAAVNAGFSLEAHRSRSAAGAFFHGSAPWHRQAPRRYQRRVAVGQR